VRKADNLPPASADVKKSEGLNLLEPCGPVQVGNGTAYSEIRKSRGNTLQGQAVEFL